MTRIALCILLHVADVVCLAGAVVHLLLDFVGDCHLLGSWVEEDCKAELVARVEPKAEFEIQTTGACMSEHELEGMQSQSLRIQSRLNRMP